MARIEINKYHRQAFREILGQFGITVELRWGDSYFGDKTVLIANISEKIRKDWRIVTQHIMFQESQQKRDHYCAVYYSLYSTGVLILQNHPYPHYSQWKYDNPGMELDHKMPKRHFPELVFNPNNWQPLTSKENKEKRAKVRPKETLDYIKLRSNGAKNKVKSLMF